MRIGHGFDAHRLVLGRDLILGGVQIPHKTGLLGHSDADVLVHALMDALLGALALGDIGTHFPDSDSRYEGISSIELLKHVRKKLEAKSYVLVNCDCTIVAQKPKIAQFIPEMRRNIASALKTELSNVGVKATTEETMGYTGKEEGICAHAVVLLRKIEAE